MFDGQRSLGLRFADSASPLKHSGSSKKGFRGVRRVKGSFVVSIGYGENRKYIGTFDDEISAAKAYNDAARLIYGSSAVLNFIARKCKHCGGALKTTRQEMYCSAACQKKAHKALYRIRHRKELAEYYREYRAAHGLLTPAPREPRTCLRCGKEFNPTSRASAYCGSVCSRKALRARYDARKRASAALAREKEERVCIQCGSAYRRIDAGSKLCSPECASKRRVALHLTERARRVSKSAFLRRMKDPAERLLQRFRNRLKNHERSLSCRPAGKANAGGLLARMEYYGFRCVYCGGPFEEVDHVIPLSSGRACVLLASNLVPSCARCNAAKGSGALQRRHSPGPDGVLP